MTNTTRDCPNRRPLEVTKVMWMASGQPRAYADSIYQFRMTLTREGQPVTFAGQHELQEAAKSICDFDAERGFMARTLDYIHKVGDSEWEVKITYPFAD